jgi:type IX secretion system PorP/SprF family membrane protein
MMQKPIKKPFLLMLLTWLAMNCYGQLDPLYSQYMFNVQAYNPAYAGTWDHLGFMILVRNQWVGFEGAPNTNALTVQAPLNNKNIGAGFTLINERIGQIRRLGISVDYSYRLLLGTDLSLRFGVKGGMNNYFNDLGSYALINPNDPVFVTDQVSINRLNFGVGTYLSSDKFYAGLSVPRLLQNELSNNTNTFELQNLILIGGYVFPITESIDFKPSFNLRYSAGLPMNADLNLSVLLHERFWLGALYRTSSLLAFGLNANVLISNNLRIGYAFDFSGPQQLQSFNYGTHEIMISYEIDVERTRYASPRYF